MTGTARTGIVCCMQWVPQEEVRKLVFNVTPLLRVAAPLDGMVSYSYHNCKLSLAVLCLLLMTCLSLAYATCFAGCGGGAFDVAVGYGAVGTATVNHSHPVGNWDVSGFVHLFLILLKIDF